MTNTWYKDAIFYEVYPRAFYDSNGDGHGEPAGAAQEDIGQSFASTRRKSFSLTRGSFHGGVSSARPYATTRETRFALSGIWRPGCFTGPRL